MGSKKKIDVLIITGSMIDPEGTIPGFLRRIFSVRKREKHWLLSAKLKLIIAEILVYGKRELKKKNLYPTWISNYFQSQNQSPSLTQVLLEELVEAEQMTYHSIRIKDVFDSSFEIKKLLKSSRCIFLSTSLLHDLSELQAVLARLSPGNAKIVVGGALVSGLPEHWQGEEGIDLVAKGYGEFLVPVICSWIQSGFQDSVLGTRVNQKQKSLFLQAEKFIPQSLDSLPVPNWKKIVSDRQLNMIFYESVRGCPYRCNFCNYPYLFDDTKFRFRSAEKMADDWAGYAEISGVKYITCLDSLFTIPHKRLVEFCNLLVKRNIKIQWICYARANDLDLETARMMKESGAIQVQIGIESGDDDQLLRMNKKASVEQNLIAIQNCNQVGITSIVSLIIGFPGETDRTLENTMNFLKLSKPDFHFLATFSTRVQSVPLLNPENRQRFGIRTDSNLHTMSPYWSHNTMNAYEASIWTEKLAHWIIQERLSLDAALFYHGLLNYKKQDREILLDFQYNAIQKKNIIFRKLHSYLNPRLEKDVLSTLAGISV